MLAIEDLHVAYGPVVALSGLSLQVAEGEIVALIGANGAGKTTLLRAISGLVRPRRGEIRLRGARIDRARAGAIVRAGIAHCPEERKIWPMMTVLENLSLGAYARADRGERKRSLESVLQHFPRLAERGSQLAGTLSGGEQQMLAIGRALMARPVLLMLDEPSLGLSPRLTQEVAAVIRGIHAEKVTILLVEQNMTMALGLAQRGYVLETGRVVLEGAAETLKHDPTVRRAYLGG